LVTVNNKGQATKYNVTLKGISVTIVAVEEQCLLRSLCVCVYVCILALLI